MFPKVVRRLLALAVVLVVVYFLFVQPSIRQRGRENDRGERRSLPETRPRSRAGEQGAPPEVACASQYFAEWRQPQDGDCSVRTRDGYQVPDPRCTPGGVNPTITETVLRDVAFRTREVRNCAESEAGKHVAYAWYGVVKPRINSNQNQVCELDHLVPLELGGADGMGNIWPQCGPDAVTLHERYFKKKDIVENYLAEQVRSGQMPLADAQRGIATNWTQYLNDADLWCGRTGRC